MHMLIAYSTTEGHSAKVARFANDTLDSAGHTGELLNLDDLAQLPDLARAKGVILVGSVHERRHSPALETFMLARREWLSERPVLLLSVSLSAAFEQGMEEAADYVTETEMRTGLTVDESVLVAGAIKPGSYDYFANQVVRFVVLKDRDYELGSTEHEFTDWTELDARLRRFIGVWAGGPERSSAHKTRDLLRQ